MNYTPPDVTNLGETARQFEWLKDETAAMGAVLRGFGNIVDNARRISDEPPVRRKPEPQRMMFTRKGKKRKTKRR